MVFKTQSKKLVSRQLPSYLDGRVLGRGSVGLGTVENKFGAPRAFAQGWKADQGGQAVSPQLRVRETSRLSFSQVAVPGPGRESNDLASSSDGTEGTRRYVASRQLSSWHNENLKRILILENDGGPACPDVARCGTCRPGRASGLFRAFTGFGCVSWEPKTSGRLKRLAPEGWKKWIPGQMQMCRCRWWEAQHRAELHGMKVGRQDSTDRDAGTVEVKGPRRSMKTE